MKATGAGHAARTVTGRRVFTLDRNANRKNIRTSQ